MVMDPKKLHAKDLYLRRTYAMTIQQYFDLLEFQGGVCAIKGCGKPPPEDGFLDVDHDHVEKVVRGILCRFHNHRLIGRHRFWKLLQAAADYLHYPPAASLFGDSVPVVPKKRRKKRPNK